MSRQDTVNGDLGGPSAMVLRGHLTGAAISVLAAEGMSGLTYRAVDQHAGLPLGSTSDHFRTREALLHALAERVAEDTATDLAALLDRVQSSATGVDCLIDSMARLVGQWITTNRDRQLARYELSLEAARQPELREVLIAGDLRFRGMIAEILATFRLLEADRLADSVAICLNGLVFDRLVGAKGCDADPGDLSATLRALLGDIHRLRLRSRVEERRRIRRRWRGEVKDNGWL